jgi:outer membrane protein OmpA-like peptidoglycan-associated protein
MVGLGVSVSELAQIQKVDTPTAPGTNGAVLQRKCSCEGTPELTGEGESCQKNRETKEQNLQRAAVNHSSVSEVPPVVHEVLQSPGQPLDKETRAFFEPRFGQDFSKVRVHTNEKAAESADASHALAYTLGHDVVFANGRYAPETASGQKLLAHELAHVAQQQRGGTSTNVEGRAWDVARRVSVGQHLTPAVIGGTAPGFYAADADSVGQLNVLPPKPSPQRPSLMTMPGLQLRLETLSGFDLNKADLKPEHRERVRELARNIQMLLLRQPGSKVVVTGHTDTTGPELYNEDLGRKRAMSVAAVLSLAGVPLQQIQIESQGEQTLAEPTADETLSANNRRVEVAIQGAPIETKMPPFPQPQREGDTSQSKTTDNTSKSANDHKKPTTTQAPSKESGVETKVILVPVKYDDGKLKATASLKVAYQLPIGYKIKSDKITASFGEVELEAEGGIGMGQKVGEPFKPKAVYIAELGASVTLIEVKLIKQIGILPKGVKAAISLNLSGNLVEAKIEPKGELKLQYGSVFIKTESDGSSVVVKPGFEFDIPWLSGKRK